MKSCLKILAIAIAAMSVTTVSSADSPEEDAIKARQGYYQVVRHNMGSLAAMAKGEIAYDAEQAASYAQNLELLTKLNNETMWIAGTSKTDMPGKTRALAEIWSTYPDIVKKSDTWKAAVSKLSVSAGKGLDALRADIGAVGKSCKGCHDDFRAKDF
jgi:cytochrome c556